MSVAIGKLNTLRVAKLVEFGAYLDGGDAGEILLPKNAMPANCAVGSSIEVFIYFDSESRIIATTKRPYAMVGEVACLKVVSVSSFGAFLDWGLPQKDLLVPRAEQKTRLVEGDYCCVFLYIDEYTGRIAASAQLDSFISDHNVDFKEGQSVDLLIAEQTEMGFKAIINNSRWGLLYTNEVFQQLTRGQKVKGFIKRIRDDKRIDLSLYPAGYKKVEDLLGTILARLKEHDGFIPLNDKTPPEDIYAFFGVSKQSFKNAIGGLYKKKLIRIDPDGIRLL